MNDLKIEPTDIFGQMMQVGMQNLKLASNTDENIINNITFPFLPLRYNVFMCKNNRSNNSNGKYKFF